MNHFICCDWGTSSLRLRLVDANIGAVSEEVSSDNGIATTYNSWNATKEEDVKRLQFYLAVLKEQLEILELKASTSLDSLPLVISGMASSSIGMLELPYKEIPIKNDGSDLEIKIIDRTSDFNHGILLISGARTDDDAMRGEETQLIGCINDDNREEQLFIIPGTHSKHIRVSNGNIVEIKTFMTGELFKLLSTGSILADSVKKTGEHLQEENRTSFEKGVADGVNSNLLNALFKVRTNSIFGKTTKETNFFYMSGLLIGSELSYLSHSNPQVTLVGDELQTSYYGAALQTLGVQQPEFFDAAAATINGHIKMFNLYRQELNILPLPTNQQSTT